MKYLIQYTFSIKNPYYLLPNFLNYYFGRTAFNNLFRFGVGKQDDKLFGENKYSGTELTGIITGVFKKNWEFDKARLSAIKKQPAPIEAFHACVAKTRETKTPSDWDLNLCKDDDNTKRGIEASIYLAKDLTAKNPIVNFHFGYLKENKEQAFENQILNLKFASELAKQEKVLITLENDFQEFIKERTFGCDPDEILKILKTVNSPWIKICFDWGHANVQARYLYENREITKEELQKFSYHKNFIEKIGQEIAYAHIHYNHAHKILNAPKMKSFYFSKNKTLDLHMPLNKISKKDAANYIETIKLLKNKTAINKYGKIMIELSRKKLFGVIPFNQFGANTNDALESLKLVRDIFKT